MNTTSRIEKTVFIAMQDAAIKFLKAFAMGGGALGANAAALMGINGTKRMATGETSQGAQELAQKVNENEKTGLLQKVAGFLQNQKVQDLILITLYIQEILIIQWIQWVFL